MWWNCRRGNGRCLHRGHIVYVSKINSWDIHMTAYSKLLLHLKRQTDKQIQQNVACLPCTTDSNTS